VKNEAVFSALGRLAVVTGGSSGLGLELVHRLLRNRTSVVILARDAQRIEQVLADCRHLCEAGTFVRGISCDASDPQLVKEAIHQIAGLGEIDLLVNCAGISEVGYASAISVDHYQDVMGTNFFGTVWPTLAVVERMKERRTGRVVIVSSLAGVKGIIGYSAYGPSKAAQINFSEALRNELLPFNVRVHLVLPGDIDTPLLHRENEAKPRETAAIAKLSKVISASQAAQEIFEGVVRGKEVIVPGFDARLTYHLARRFPGLMTWVINRIRLRSAASSAGPRSRLTA
jgi:3-dehydrosphinganine reductase